jgi:hypothetical protein
VAQWGYALRVIKDKWLCAAFVGKVKIFIKTNYSILPNKHKIKAHELWLVGGVPSPSGRVRDGAGLIWKGRGSLAIKKVFYNYPKLMA